VPGFDTTSNPNASPSDRAHSPPAAPHTDMLETDLAGLTLANPLLLAAGTAGTLDEMADVLDLRRVGALVTKSITPDPREGNDTWRIIEHRAGMLNAIGLANVGLERFLDHYASRISSLPTRVIASVAGFRIDDYVRVAGALDEVDGVAGLELNVSCPNVEQGTEFGSDPKLLADLLAAVRPVVRRSRLFVKLSPIPFSPPGMPAVARAAIDPPDSRNPAGPNARPGADGLVIANTMPAMAIDVHSRESRLANVSGGLSGPALHPVTCKLIHDVYRAVARDSGTPIVGCGGVMRWQDAAEFILAGATAVQLGTVLFVNPRAPMPVSRGLRAWVHQQRANSIRELVGAVRGS